MGTMACSTSGCAARAVSFMEKTAGFFVEYTADVWYLDVVSGTSRTPIKTSNNENMASSKIQSKIQSKLSTTWRFGKSSDVLDSWSHVTNKRAVRALQQQG
jgi:hypothetical protein